jgi:hypothetical protein
VTISDILRGDFVHSWTEVPYLNTTIEVSTDAIMVRGIRHAYTPVECQQIADAIGPDVYLPTPQVLDLRWSHAAVHINPVTGSVKTFTDAQHSARVSQLVAGRPGLVSNVGKHWVLHRSMAPNKAVLYGWHVPLSAADEGGKSWRGIKLHPAGPGAAGCGVIQPIPASVFHNMQHKDYSMTGVFMRVKPADIGLVVPDFVPRRVPGVAITTTDAYVPWKDGKKPYVERVIELSLAEVARGGLETLGVNAGPRIVEYMAGVTRLVKGKEKKLGITSGNWCASGACFAAHESLVGSELPPHPYRCSGIELERDAKAMGIWGAKGDYRPQRGDLRIMLRGKDGSWERHVCRELHVDSGSSVTVGANEGDRWRITDRAFDDGKTLGWVKYPGPRESVTWPAWRDHMKAAMAGDGMDEVAALIKRLGPELSG